MAVVSTAEAVGGELPAARAETSIKPTWISPIGEHWDRLLAEEKYSGASPLRSMSYRLPRGMVFTQGSHIATEIDRISDKELLRVRFCDLPIRLEGTLVDQRAQKVFAELADRRIRGRPSI